jgi:hypothetical protein
MAGRPQKIKSLSDKNFRAQEWSNLALNLLSHILATPKIRIFSKNYSI